MDGATGDPIREYIWLGALPIGYVDRLGASGASRLFFIHADHLARPQKITDGSRAIVWDGVFAPFGEIHSITGGIVNVLMFPGQVYDSETGFSQNWHRNYDMSIGRYLESDPIGLAGGINMYAYVGGNPNGYSDPDGKQAVPAPAPAWGPPIPPQYIPGTPANQEWWRQSNALGRDLEALLAGLYKLCFGDADCEKVKKNCYKMCIDQYVEDRSKLPGTGHDYKGRIRRCIRECMEANGCKDF
jgi:RHS repeat-associated protein